MRHPSLVPLSHDHHHALALALRCRKQALGQIKPMGALGLKERAEEVLAFYRGNLRVHFRVEEEFLFPFMRAQVVGSAAMIDDLVAQHQQLAQLLTQIEKGSGLAKLIFDLGDLLERHVRKEERELFPLFEAQVAADEAERIGLEIKARLAKTAT